jgi:hypothetical protein
MTSERLSELATDAGGREKNGTRNIDLKEERRECGSFAAP